MHKVAKISALTNSLLKLPAPPVGQLRHRRVLDLNRPPSINSPLNSIKRSTRTILVLKAHVRIALKVLGSILTNIDIVDAPVARHFRVHVLVEIIEVRRLLVRRDARRRQTERRGALADLRRRYVHVREEKRRGKKGLVV